MLLTRGTSMHRGGVGGGEVGGGMVLNLEICTNMALDTVIAV